MAAEEQKAMALQAFAAFNRSDLDTLFSFFDPACCYPDPSPSAPAFPSTLQGHQQFLSALISTFTERSSTLEMVIAEGDRVMAWVTVHATPTGPWRHLPATNKRASFRGVECFRLAQGKVVEHRFLFDTFGALQQIGALPQYG
jgi:steroid delta-isomerase-like uncharacterized protein